MTRRNAISKLRGLAFVFACFGVPVCAHAQDKATLEAYHIALKCFVADGVASGNADDRRDTENASAYEKKARQSFDTAMNLGDVLHYEGSHVNQDFGLTQAAELPKMVKNKSYLFTTLLTCKSAGL